MVTVESCPVSSLCVGSRDSQLALAQAHHVIDKLKQRDPQLQITLKTYKTQGDLILDRSLSAIGDKGLFVKELETALLSGDIDLAVHSLKDMPTVQPAGLQLIPFGTREIPWDAFISASPQTTFESLPAGATIGTSSLRRQAFLKQIRPDLRTLVLRGNVQTRLRKLTEEKYDGIILAAAGLHRLGLADCITHTFSPEQLLPACGQGILALELPQDSPVLSWLSALCEPHTHAAFLAERTCLTTMEGGCQLPIGIYSTWHSDQQQYQIKAQVTHLNGVPSLSAQAWFHRDAAVITGRQLAEQLLSKGAQALMTVSTNAS